MASTTSSDPGHSSRPTEQPIQLRFDDKSQVLVIDSDQDRFYTTVSDAARACKQEVDLDAWTVQVKEFLLEINRWCKHNEATVTACYVMWSDGHYNIILVTAGEEYNFGFDDAVTQLNFKLSSMYPDIPLDAIQIPSGPEGMLHSFINPEQAMQPYGQSSAT